MTHRAWIHAALAALVLAGLVSGCNKTVGEAPASASAPAAMVGQENAEGNFLAYTHEATIRMPADGIVARVAAVRNACMQQAHGACTVLGETQSSGQDPGGSLLLRADPAAIEPLVALAADGAEVAQRSTEAEDLADEVRDNGLRRQRLIKQHARLSEFLERRDIKAADMIALSNQLAEIEAELEAAEQEAAQQQRRIRTNLLTLTFESSRVTASDSELRHALDDALDVLDTSVAVLLTLVVAALPFVLFIGAIWWVFRWRRRRRPAKPA